MSPSGCHDGISSKVRGHRLRHEDAAQRLHETAHAGEPMNGVEVDVLHSSTRCFMGTTIGCIAIMYKCSNCYIRGLCSRPLPDHIRFAKRTVFGDSREQEIRQIEGLEAAEQ